ncbi:unnamed protein product [Oikopleura dioica]|uniref:Uncharacterized protein n=1 Tax=Oikopleura dioica TaxID=34765 RepID=E4XAE7_OIKDI|nr:unnamed protein product [Oikopleura dioica]
MATVSAGASPNVNNHYSTETSTKMHKTFQRSSTGVDQVTGWAVNNKPVFLAEAPLSKELSNFMPRFERKAEIAILCE